MSLTHFQKLQDTFEAPLPWCPPSVEQMLDLCIDTSENDCHLLNLHKSAEHLLKDGFKVFMIDCASDLPSCCADGPQMSVRAAVTESALKAIIIVTDQSHSLST